MTKEFEDRGNTYTIRENVSNIGEIYGRQYYK